MNKKSIEQYLVSQGIFSKPKISYISKGSNYQMYLAEENGKSYAFRCARTDVMGDNFLEYEYHILRFIESLGVDFSPRPIKFDKQKKISIQTYIRGSLKAVSDLSVAQLEQFVDKQFQLHGIKLEDYLKFCKQNKIKARKPDTRMDRVKQYGINEYKHVKRYCDDEEVIAWIKPRLQEIVSECQTSKGKKVPVIFNHRDLAGSNIILDGRKLYFIDWDQARFMECPDYWLSYIFTHDQGMTKSKQEMLYRLYAKYTKLSIPYLRKQTYQERKIAMVHGVIWAVRRYADMKNGGLRGWRQYQKLYQTRMREYDEYIKYGFKD